MNMRAKGLNLNERVGAALQRAADKLPRHYDILLEVASGSIVVALYIPPIGDEDGGQRVTDFGDCDDVADRIESAVNRAIEHCNEHGHVADSNSGPSI